MKKINLLIPLLLVTFLCGCGHTHTCNIGVCTKCGEIQNENDIRKLVNLFDQATEAGNELVEVLDGVDNLSADEAVEVIKNADEYIEKLKSNMSEISVIATNYQELSELQNNVNYVVAATPQMLCNNSEGEIKRYIEDYSNFLAVTSDSFMLSADELRKLSRAENDNVKAPKGFFEEVDGMITPDSFSTDMVFDYVKKKRRWNNKICI